MVFGPAGAIIGMLAGAGLALGATRHFASQAH
jgi:hypothetical protein